jgi:DNA-binding transcriptional LysR family regulator
MKMNLERLKVFYVVAKEGSLANAAKKLHIAQPALSRTIKLLEDELKTQLFERMSKLGLRLTPQGERVLEFTHEILEKAENFEKSFLDNTIEPQGEIIIATTPFVGETVLSSCLLDFCLQYPKIRINILTTTKNVNVSEADIAVRTYIPNQLDLIQTSLGVYRIKLWASKDYLEKNGTPNQASDLDNHRVLVFEKDKHNTYTNTNWILHAGREEKEPRDPFYQINSNEGLYQLALRGYGIIQLPELFVKLRGYELQEVLPAVKGPEVEIFYIYSKRLRGAKRILLLEEFLKANFEKIKED